MLKNRVLYYLINLVFMVAALCFIDYGMLPNIHFEWPMVIGVIMLFLLIHAARFMRMYLVLLEDLIRPRRFLQLYIKTTFVSSLIPFKIGEVYKMYCYEEETDNTLKGIMSVLIEKYFDAMVLCMFMVPYAIINRVLSPLLVILLVFMICVIVVYFSFGSTYKYLNKFLICRATGRKSLLFLRMLEFGNKTYEEVKNTLKGRFVLLLFLSIIAWISEGLLFTMINAGDGGVSFGAIFNYVNDVFLGVANAAFGYYSAMLVAMFLIVLIVLYGRKYLGDANKERRDLWWA